ncbi:hypothetical protein [Maribacter cobaltidurans]|uniref:Uncharacterized protein n=2 Tax=Maribacter cobaltidurans TaxID=1178778 RepID=A0A223V5Y1_9FLAO|nr:hypothetical protein [Maribacter cobaltidurans]ASV30813.1 hypothetical protein CJ263_11620 [Maribacter cobaltidurans]GGD81969.1 hypothetical protein GCM10011412_19690 [Maribacter cobaltidurans]
MFGNYSQKLISFAILMILFSCDKEVLQDSGNDENTNTPSDSSDTVQNNCTGETTNIGETYFLFDPDQTSKANRVVEEGDDRSNAFIQHDGGFVCTGTFNETSRFAGDGNLALYALDENLDLKWMFKKEKGEFYDVIATSDNHYVAVGRLEDKDVSTIYVVKTTEEGELTWQFEVNTGVDNDLGGYASTIIENPVEDGYLVFGKAVSGSDLFGFGNDSFILCLNSQGEQKWVKSIGNSAVPIDVIQTNEGNFILIQYDVDIIVSEITSAGQVIASKKFGSSKNDRANHILSLQDGNFLITGTTWGDDQDVSDNTGNSDAWLLVIDKHLNLVKEQTLGGYGYQSGVETFQRKNGTLFMYGNTSNSDFFIDSSWNDEWFVSLDSELCILNWYTSGLYSDRKASDLLYFEDENKVARFHDTNSEIYNNRPQMFYDHYIIWRYLKP